MNVFSYSSLSTFEQCQRKYWYAYIGKPEIEVIENIEAFMGSRVHDALEYLYEQVTDGHVPIAEDLLAWFDEEWDRQWSDDIRIVNTERTPDQLQQLGRDELSGYYRRYHPFDQDETIGLEHKIWIDLDGSGRYRLIGYIDRLARPRDGTYEIHDYKSSNYRPTQEEADEDQQLALYQIGIQQKFPDAHDVDLVWHYLRHGVELRSRRTPEQIEVLQNDCQDVIDEIVSLGRDERVFPTEPSGLCRWCEYQAICPVGPVRWRD